MISEPNTVPIPLKILIVNTSLVLLSFEVLTSAGTGNTDGGGTGTNELGGGVNVAVGNGGGQGALNN